MRILAALTLFVVACGGSARPCDGVKGACTEFIAGATSESDIAEAFATAADGTTLAFSGGTFTFANTLTLAKAKSLVVRGAGAGKTVLRWTGQGDGLVAQDGTDGVTLQDFTARDAAGDVVRVSGSNGVFLRRLEAVHGRHGLSVVGCTNALVEDSTASGATEAGVLVAQGTTVLVRRNSAHDNVAGVELQNSASADVTENKLTGNSAGVLVVSLPGLQQDGHDVRVFKNELVANNGKNLAPAGTVEAFVPPGIGALLLASHDVEFFGNTVIGNTTAGFMVAAVTAFASGTQSSDAAYPTRIWAHDNTSSNDGAAPDTSLDFGALLALGQHGTNAYPGGAVPALVWDGAPSPAGSQQICLQGAAGDHTANLHLDQLDSAKPPSNWPAIIRYDADAGVDCALTPLPAVTVPGA